MTAEEILSAELTKAEKARRLYDLGHTRRDVAQMICGGNFGWAHNIYKRHFGLETRTRVNNQVFDREFGIEIESFGIRRGRLSGLLRDAGIQAKAEARNRITVSYWKVVNDSSISGEDRFELISPILRGQAGLQEVERVCNILGEAGARVNKSCGLHIHFNARRLTITDWRNLFKNYINLETDIDSIMPGSRRASNNHYCKSMLHHFTSKNEAFAAIDRAGDVAALHNSVTQQDRHFKLNAGSYQRHGTIEFRQHSGTIDFEKISHWIMICDAIINRSGIGLVTKLNNILTADQKRYFNQRKQIFRI
ncbi:amidoligase family protein [Chitinophaga sp. OAE865]|uniref:amidoligase family protein n=1 Tax=Chitinophaga sp. OAE865 TaxID=2817898 RepID=UPI001AE5C84B